MISNTGVIGYSPMWIQVDDDCTNGGTLFMENGNIFIFTGICCEGGKYFFSKENF